MQCTIPSIKKSNLSITKNLLSSPLSSIMRFIKINSRRWALLIFMDRLINCLNNYNLNCWILNKLKSLKELLLIPCCLFPPLKGSIKACTVIVASKSILLASGSHIMVALTHSAHFNNSHAKYKTKSNSVSKYFSK